MKNKSHILFGVLILFCTAISVFISFTWSSTIIDLSIDLIILALIVACVVIPYFTGYGVTRNIRKDLKRATQYIKTNKNINPSDLESSFINPHMHQCYINYLEAVKTDTDTGNVVVDIKDYFDVEFLDSISKKEFSEQISGALTGLGILGTFIGLSVGLAQFNLGNNMDTNEMQNSISGLMNGIRAAFYTSIFGVGYSIITNFFLKTFYSEVYDALEEFIASYENNTIPSPQEVVLKNIISNQETQTELLENFSASFAEAIAKQIEVVISPVADRLNSSLDLFMEKSVATHNESLEIIVNSFVESMNSSIGDQFTEFGRMLTTLNKTQYENNERLQQLVDIVCTNAINIQNVNDSLKESVETLSHYMTSLKTMQSELQIANSEILHNVENIGVLTEKQAESVASLAEQQTLVCDNISKMNGILTSYQETTEVISLEFNKLFLDFSNKLEEFETNSCKQNEEYISSISKITTDGTNAIANQSDITKRILEDVVEQTKSSFEKISLISSEQNKIIAESFAKAIEQSSQILNTELERANEISEKMDIHMNRSAETLSNAYKELEKDITRVLKNTFDSFDEQISQMSQHFSGTLKQSDETISHMDRYMQTAPEALYSVIESLISEMEGAIKQLNEASNKTSRLINNSQ